MRADVCLRPMTLEDVQAVAELDRLSFSLPWPERSFRFEVSENECSRCWVAEFSVDGQPRTIGMLVLWQILDEAHIATFAVHPDFRKQGIGEYILLEALRKARADGARRAFLEVRASNEAAQNMYRKYGFEVAGCRRMYYKDNSEDAILMNLENLSSLTGENG